MSSNIALCDGCKKIVQKRDLHGWFEVRTYITKPTHEQFDIAMSTPQGQAVVAAGDITPANMPAILGGDFCGMPCLLKYYTEQLSVMEAMEAPALDPRVAEKQIKVADEPTPRTFGWDEDRGYM